MWHHNSYYLLCTYTGAMNIICDMNEYRKAIKEFNVCFTFLEYFFRKGSFSLNIQNPFLDELFGSLQALCNIFIVKPENLPQVCSEEPYVSCCNVPLNNCSVLLLYGTLVFLCADFV